MTLAPRTLGSTPIEISPLGLGTWSFGGRAYGPMSTREARLVLEKAMAVGIDFFDTSSNYGNGRSEEILGQALKPRRDEIVLCTKGGNGLEAGRAVKRFDPDFLERALAQSLRRLQTDYVDIYLLHNPPVQVLREGTVFEWLERQVGLGKIRHWGASLYDNYEDARLALDAGAQVIEARYSLLRTDLLPRIENDLRAAGCAFIARSPLDSGLLTGKYGIESTFDATNDYRARWSRRFLKSADAALDELSWLVSEGFCETIHEAAIRFAVYGAGVTAAIPGAKTPEQLLINFQAALKGPLPQEALTRITLVRDKYHEEIGLH